LVRPSRLGVDISAPLEAVILKAMSPNARDRYRTTEEFKEALERSVKDTSGADRKDNVHTRRPAERGGTLSTRQASPRSNVKAEERRVRDENDYTDYTSYPLKYKRKTNKSAVTITIVLVCACIVLLSGAALMFSGAVWDALSPFLPSGEEEQIAATLPQSTQLTPPPTQTKENPPTQTPTPTQEPEPTPVATPYTGDPAFMPGAVPRLSIEEYVPLPNRQMVYKEGKTEFSYLTGTRPGVISAYIEYDFKNNVPESDLTRYLLDNGGNLVMSVSDATTFTLVLPKVCAVGATWHSAAKDYEVVAVNYSASLSGNTLDDLIVIKTGEIYYYYAPNIGVYATSKELGGAAERVLTKNSAVDAKVFANLFD
jgi:hypothetical protein